MASGGQATQRLRELAGGFTPDWSDYRQEKASIYRDVRAGKFCTTSVMAINFGEPVYFSTEKEAYEAIKAMGDDLYYVFGMKPPEKAEAAQEEAAEAPQPAETEAKTKAVPKGDLADLPEPIASLVRILRAVTPDVQVTHFPLN